MKNFKRVLSLALAALMVIGGLVVAPVDAKADETTYTKIETLEGVVDGNYVIVAAWTNTDDSVTYYSLGTLGSSYHAPVEVTIGSNNTITPVDSNKTVQEWAIDVIDETNHLITIARKNGTTSYYLTDNFATKISEKTELTDAAKWVISDTLAYTDSNGNPFTHGNTNDGKFSIESSQTQDGKTYQRALTFRVLSSGNRWCGYSDYSTVKLVDGYMSELLLYKSNSTSNNNGNQQQTPVYTTTKEKYDAAAKLGDNELLPGGPYTLEGVVTAIDYLYTSKNGVSFTFTVDDISFYCYGLKADGADKIEKGDTVKLTGDITCYKGTVQLANGTLDKLTVGTHEEPKAPADASAKTIVEALYALDNGKTLPGGPYTLTGKITKIVTEYNAEKGNVTVNIEVEGKEVQCYKLTGTGIDKLAINDEITVKGELKRYNKTYEFDAPTLVVEDKVDDTTDSGNGNNSGNEGNSGSQSGSEADKAPTQKEIVDAAFKLGAGEYLGGSKDKTYTLKGTVVSLEDAQEYKGSWERMVTIKVEGKEMLCYYLKGSEADLKSLKEGSVITVTGPIKNYVDKNGVSTIEFEKPQLAKINATGDFSTTGITMILFAGVACLAVAFVSKKKMA